MVKSCLVLSIIHTQGIQTLPSTDEWGRTQTPLPREQRLQLPGPGVVQLLAPFTHRPELTLGTCTLLLGFIFQKPTLML